MYKVINFLFFMTGLLLLVIIQYAHGQQYSIVSDKNIKIKYKDNIVLVNEMMYYNYTNNELVTEYRLEKEVSLLCKHVSYKNNGKLICDIDADGDFDIEIMLNKDRSLKWLVSNINRFYKWFE